MFAPFCAITKKECALVGKGDPCSLSEKEWWAIIDGKCSYQVPEDWDEEEDELPYFK